MKRSKHIFIWTYVPLAAALVVFILALFTTLYVYDGGFHLYSLFVDGGFEGGYHTETIYNSTPAIHKLVILLVVISFLQVASALFAIAAVLKTRGITKRLAIIAVVLSLLLIPLYIHNIVDAVSWSTY